MDSKLPISVAAYTGQTSRKALVFMARICEGSERYEDMCAFVRALVLSGVELTSNERNLFAASYKNVVGHLRAAWRAITPEEDLFSDLLVSYRQTLEQELERRCKDALELLETHLIESARTTETKVFYLKMAGDYYRYMAEFSDASSVYVNKSLEFYQEALELAKELMTTDPIRLGLVLNYSVCLYEVVKDKNKACTVANEAFDKAIANLDDLPEAAYKDSTLILQLLRDNITLWVGEDDG